MYEVQRRTRRLSPPPRPAPAAPCIIGFMPIIIGFIIPPDCIISAKMPSVQLPNLMCRPQRVRPGKHSLIIID